MRTLAPGAGDEVLAPSAAPGAGLGAQTGGCDLEALVGWLVLGWCVSGDSDMATVKPSCLIQGCRGFLGAAQATPGLRGGVTGVHKCSPPWLGEFQTLGFCTVGRGCGGLSLLGTEWLCS